MSTWDLSPGSRVPLPASRGTTIGTPATTAIRTRSSTRWSTRWRRRGSKTGSSPGATSSATTPSPAGMPPGRDTARTSESWVIGTTGSRPRTSTSGRQAAYGPVHRPGDEVVPRTALRALRREMPDALQGRAALQSAQGRRLERLDREDREEAALEPDRHRRVHLEPHPPGVRSGTRAVRRRREPALRMAGRVRSCSGDRADRPLAEGPEGAGGNAPQESHDGPPAQPEPGIRHDVAERHGCLRLLRRRVQADSLDGEV